MPIQHDEDDQRMIRLQEGDASAFDDIVATWQGPLFRFFYRNTRDTQRAEDLVQETLLKLYRRSWDFVPTGAFRGWLFRVARNLLIDNVRRRKTDALLRPVTTTIGPDGETRSLVELLPDDLLPVDAAIARQELADVVDGLLRELPAEQRETFTLHHFESLTLSEVADAMQTSLPTAKSRLRLAREKLRYALTCRGFTDAGVSENN
ncbi:MAG: sigma-70 family RNA polymerase sigma factor [Planctomycetaceae bacterium]|nr:sigma-70 family RNA polymerase sigma factor [Planctomycetaceae bacterium]